MMSHVMENVINNTSKEHIIHFMGLSVVFFSVGVGCNLLDTYFIKKKIAYIRNQEDEKFILKFIVFYSYSIYCNENTYIYTYTLFGIKKQKMQVKLCVTNATFYVFYSKN